MNIAFAMRRLLAVLMTAGLVLAPVSRPVIAMQASTQAMADEMASPEMPSLATSASGTMVEMPDDMHCCPSKAQAAVDCDKCVSMAACGSIYFAGVLATISHPLPIVSDKIAHQRTDAWADGLGHPPPEQPPRSLV